MASNVPMPMQIEMKNASRDKAAVSMVSYREAGILTDLKLLLKDSQTVEVHKIVMFSHCPYLANLVGTNSTELTEVKLSDISHDTLRPLVNYMYGLQQELEWDHLKDVLAACIKLKLDYLKEDIVTYVVENVSVNDCIGWWRFAEASGLTQIASRARFLMLMNLEEVKGSSEFKELSYDQLIAYTTHDEVMLPNRDTMLMACIEWVDYEPAARTRHVFDLLKYTCLESCSIGVLNTVATKYSDLVAEPDVRNEIYKATLPMMKKTANGQVKSLFHYEQSGNELHFYKSHMICHKWKLFTKLDARRSVRHNTHPTVHVTIVPNGLAVIFLISIDSNNQNALFDATSNTWNEFPQIPEKVTNIHNVTSVYCNRHVYVLDWENVFKLNLETRAWSKGPKMPINISRTRQIKAVGAQNHIYMMAMGRSHEDTATNLYNFNSINQKWSQLQSPPPEFPGILQSVLVTDGKHLYVIGEIHDQPDVYTIAEDTWSIPSKACTDEVNNQRKGYGRNSIHSADMLSSSEIICFYSSTLTPGAFKYAIYYVAERSWSASIWNEENSHRSSNSSTMYIKGIVDFCHLELDM